jgi:hypothetical protein
MNEETECKHRLDVKQRVRNILPFVERMSFLATLICVCVDFSTWRDPSQNTVHRVYYTVSTGWVQF